MQILFVRHGESVDDLENRYGGWSDFPLTNAGQAQIQSKLPKIENLGVEFEIVLSSPLQRAKETARIIASQLGLTVETFEYIKERNTYGLLSGMVKVEAANKYPEQVAKLAKDEYVDGSERYADLTARVLRGFQLMQNAGYENVIAVTHGNFLKCFVKEVMRMQLKKKDDGGFMLLDATEKGILVLAENGIEVA